MVEKEQQTPEEIITKMKVELEDKYKKERELLAEKKKQERNELRKIERKLKKQEQDKLGKIIYEKYGVQSVIELESEYEVVKKGEVVPKAKQNQVAEGSSELTNEKLTLIHLFYKETGEWCLEKQKEGTLKDTSVSNRVANFFRSFYNIK